MSNWGRVVAVLAVVSVGCGGSVFESEPSGDAGASGSAGSAGSAGTGGAAGSGGVAGTGGGTGGIAGTGGTPVDAGVDVEPGTCADNEWCGPNEWCDFEPAPMGMCSTGGKMGVCRPRPELSECPVWDDQCPGACGCDGTWFCDDCRAHASGIPVTENNLWCAPPPNECGGFIGEVCGPDEWCDFPDMLTCGWTDGTGQCQPKPSACPDNCPGVCGCDMQFYCNECDANVAGVDITGGNECMGEGDVGQPCSSVSDCKSGLACCYPCGQSGCTNECTEPMPDGSCPAYP